MKKKAINLAQTPIAIKRVLFAFLFFSVWAAPNVGANPLLAGEKVVEAYVLQDAKQTAVKGTVVDSNGEPLIGVSIKVVGTSVGTATDFEGKFTVNVPQVGSVLEFTYVGYVSKRVTVGSNTTIDVVLEDDSQMLGTVVVTAPIGVQRAPKELGYSVSSISSKQLTEAGNTNFASAMYGKAAGVKITTPPGGATGAVNIQIRGVNSLNYQQQPLYVVDGVMIRNDAQNGADGANNKGYWDDQRIRGNGIADINPNDIETMTILKGASASALYGSDAASGVVVITTKKGSREEGLGVELNYNGAFESVSNIPHYQTVYGPGSRPSSNLNAGATIDGWYTDTRDGKTYQRPMFQTSAQFGPKYNGEDVLWWDGTVKNYSGKKDQIKELFQVGYTSNLNVALSKQTDAVNYRLSYSRLDYTGTQRGSEMQKNTFNLNTNVKFHKKASLDVVASYVNTNTLNRPESMTQLFNSSAGFYNSAESMSTFLTKYQTTTRYKWVPFDKAERNPEEALRYQLNPVNLLDYLWKRLRNQYEEEENRLITSATLNWDIAEKVKLRGRIGNDFTAMNTQDKRYAEYPEAFAPVTGTSDRGTYELTKNQYSIIYGDALLTYADKFTPDFGFTIAGGFQGRNESYLSQTSSSKDGLIIENWFSLDNSFSPVTSKSTTKELLKYAYLGILNLSYKDMLFLEATARQEYSSTLPPKNNGFFYWSTNTSFIFSEAFSLPSWMTYGKARASFGVVGNTPPMYVANIAFGQKSLQTPTGSVIGQNMTNAYGNLELEAEMKHEWEFGLETRFWDDRVNFDVSYYNNKIKKQITAIEVPYSSGSETMLMNVGEVGNQGLELAISVTPFIGDFRWTSRFNMGFNQSKVNSLAPGVKELKFWDEDQGSIKISASVGETLGNIYSYVRERDEKTGELLVNDNGLWIIDKTKYEKVGNIMPKVVGGWSNTFNYKAFSLDFTLDYRFGGQMVSPSMKYQTASGRFDNTLAYRDAENGGLPWTYVHKDNNGNVLGTYDLNNGVILEGINANTGLPNDKIISAADYYTNTYTWGANGWNDAMVQDNSFIKFREITLGYRIPQELSSKIGMSNLRVSLFGRNLFYIWKTLENVDPEAPIGNAWWSQGVDAGASLASKSLGFSINAKF